MLRHLPENQPSLFIQWSDSSITDSRVRNVIDELNLGLVGKIQARQTLNKKNQERGFIFYIHFDEWYRNPTADKVREKLISSPNEFIKVHYEPNKYWKIFANKHNAITPIFKPTITFSNEDTPTKHVNRERFIPRSKPIPNSENITKKYKWKDDGSDDET